MTNVFISWSGDQSKKIAEELRNWIPSVLQFAKPYFTPNDIEKGSKWSSEISKKLSESNIGIICLTKDNINKPWILFEAGALAKNLDQSRVCSILFGMENTDLSGPLTTFQTTNFEKSDFKKMMQSINASAGTAALSNETFDRVFEMWWPQLHEKISATLSQPDLSKEEVIRSDRDLLEEVLSLTRLQSRSLKRDTNQSHVPRQLISDLIESIQKLMEFNRKFLDHRMNDELQIITKATQFLTNRNDTLDEAIFERIDQLLKEQEDFIPF